MSFLSNIKFQYNLKILEDLLSSGDIKSLFDNIEKHRSNKKLYIQLLFNLGLDAIKKLDENIFSSKISWINSYFEEDTNYLANFLSFYFKESNNEEPVPVYEQDVLTQLSSFQDIKEVNFSDFVNYCIMKSLPSLEKQLKNPTIVYENNFEDF